jgi:DNA-binding Lrp family transcriptional regulator
MLKDVELKLVKELVRNSRRSNRQLAETIGVSQPTVNRLVKKLEKEGVIREYTMVPDHVALGFQIMSVTFARLKEAMSDDDVERARKFAHEMLKKRPTATMMIMNGIGLDADRAVVAFHRDYSDYVEFMTLMKEYPLVVVEEVKSFLVDLLDRSHFQQLTFSPLADYLAKTLEHKSEK